MKLYIKQKVFSWKDRFTVWDEQGRERYYAEGELFSWGKKLRLTDADGNETAYIEQEVLRWRPRFHVFIGGEEVAEIVKYGFIHPSYAIEGPGWTAEGSFLEHYYTVTEANDRIVAEIHKQWMTWGDCYEIDVYDDRDELLALTTVLVIDCVLAMQSNN